MRTTVVLLTRDLRLHDNPALAAACAADRTVPLYVLDPKLAGLSPNRTRFLHQCLADLRKQLRTKGGDLIVREGDPVAETIRVARHTGATTITTEDGTQIYYKDWGAGQPVVFSHGWPLNADAWEDQMVFLGLHGYRCIAHDRRGHGRSSQPWQGNDMDTYADDLAELVDALDLRDAIHVGHSTGGGEVARYISRHGSDRVAKAAPDGYTLLFHNLTFSTTSVSLEIAGRATHDM